MKADKVVQLATWIDAAREDNAEPEGYIVYHKQRLAEWQAKKAANDNKIERTKRFIQMLLAGEKLKAGGYSFYYASQPSVFIEDVSLLPEELLRRNDPEPRKDEIKKRLNAGKEIPGCSLVDGIPSLVIR